VLGLSSLVTHLG